MVEVNRLCPKLLFSFFHATCVFQARWERKEIFMDTINWEPQEVIYLAENLSKMGNKFRLTISNIYKEYNNIGIMGLWIGKDYNMIAKDILNSSRNIFEEYSDFIQFTVPEKLYEIAKKQYKDEPVDFFLYKSTSDIKAIEYSIEKSDGSFKLNINEVKNIVDNKITVYCQEADKQLQEYCRQFEELTSIDNSLAILIMHQKVEEMTKWSRGFLKSFIQDLRSTTDRIIRNVKATDEETIRKVTKM